MQPSCIGYIPSWWFGFKDTEGYGITVMSSQGQQVMVQCLCFKGMVSVVMKYCILNLCHKCRDAVDNTKQIDRKISAKILNNALYGLGQSLTLHSRQIK